MSRTKGAKTKVLTPAMKIADEYIGLLCKGMKPIQARRKIAGEWGTGITEETVRQYGYRHAARLTEEYEREFAEYAAQFVDPDKAIAAMHEVASWRNEQWDRWMKSLPSELAALESEDAIRAKLTEIFNAGLMELHDRAIARAKELSNEPGSDIDPAIPHGGVIYLETFAASIKPRQLK